MSTVQDYLEYDVYDWRKHHHDNVECRKRAEYPEPHSSHDIH